jgi:hypothetical protein
MDTEERKNKIRLLVGNLTNRFNELLWECPDKLERLKVFKPGFEKEFWKRWDELDNRFVEYLDGKIEWDGYYQQLELKTFAPHNPPVLMDASHFDRDIEGYSADLFAWVVLQTKSL